MAGKQQQPTEPTAPAAPAPEGQGVTLPSSVPAAAQEMVLRVVHEESQRPRSPGLRAENRMTAERAERVELAEDVAELNANPRNVAIREGGIFKSSGGDYVDGMGVIIPLEELPEALQARVKGEVDRQGRGKTKPTGADHFEPSHREKRDGGKRA